MDTIDYKARVAKGAEVLDERIPGWPSMIVLDKLDVCNPWHCVLAQTVGHDETSNPGRGSFGLGVCQLGMDDTELAEHGFFIPDTDYERLLNQMTDPDAQSVGTQIYAPLTDAWRELIAERLKNLEPVS